MQKIGSGTLKRTCAIETGRTEWQLTNSAAQND
jgi:hypothetical protein